MRQPLALGRYGTRQNDSGTMAPGGRLLAMASDRSNLLLNPAAMLGLPLASRASSKHSTWLWDSFLESQVRSAEELPEIDAFGQKALGQLSTRALQKLGITFICRQLALS